MKYLIVAILLLFPIVVDAFLLGPSTRPAFAATCLASSSSTIITGPSGKAASSKEEDLFLTLRIILDHEERSTTVSKEQFISQMQDFASIRDDNEPADVSVPYDAAAQLAYQNSDKSMRYDDFKAKYEADAVEFVKLKQKNVAKAPVIAALEANAVTDSSVISQNARSESPVDLSIPYDAAAQLAYAISDKSLPFDSFRRKYEADAVEEVKSKHRRSAKSSTPKATQLAAEASSELSTLSSVSSSKFSSTTTENEESTPVTKSEPSGVDLSIPYDAAARLAFQASDQSVPFTEFKASYEAACVDEVIAKRKKK